MLHDQMDNYAIRNVDLLCMHFLARYLSHKRGQIFNKNGSKSPTTSYTKCLFIERTDQIKQSVHSWVWIWYVINQKKVREDEARQNG